MTTATTVTKKSCVRLRAHSRPYAFLSVIIPDISPSSPIPDRFLAAINYYESIVKTNLHFQEPLLENITYVYKIRFLRLQIFHNRMDNNKPRHTERVEKQRQQAINMS